MVSRSRGKLRIGWGAGILLLAAWPVNAQSGARLGSPSDAQAEIVPRAMRSSSPARSDEDPRSGAVVRVIDDPSTGNYWLLERDPRHPGGPGRLVLVPRKAGADGPGRAGEDAGSPDAAEAPVLIQLTPVIRAGDPLIVEENTPVVEARLEGVALGPAVLGATFEARLRIGGKVVRAVALGAGRAAFADEIGARP